MSSEQNNSQEIAELENVLLRLRSKEININQLGEAFKGKMLTAFMNFPEGKDSSSVDVYTTTINQHRAIPVFIDENKAEQFKQKYSIKHSIEKMKFEMLCKFPTNIVIIPNAENFFITIPPNTFNFDTDGISVGSQEKKC